MKGVRFTKAELAFLDDAMSSLVGTETDALQAKHPFFTVRDKLRAATEAPSGVSVGPIEEALLGAARGKAIKLEGGHARASKQLTAMKVTAEDAKLVGEWMARQGWLTGPMTLLDVLNKWYQWLPKARATQPPPALPAGLGTNDARSKEVPHVREGSGGHPGTDRARPGFGSGRSS